MTEDTGLLPASEESQCWHARADVVALAVRGLLDPFVLLLCLFYSRWAAILKAASRSSITAEAPAISTKFLALVRRKRPRE